MTQKISAAITAVGGYVPEDILSNGDLEKLVDTNDEWIRTRTGISERRILKGADKGTSDLCVPAVLQLCKKRGIHPSEIDCIIVGTVTPDMLFPSTANLVCEKIGAVNAWGFDLLAACSGFLYSLTTGASLIESGRYQKVVVVGADKMSSIVDYSDRSTCIIFGDGAGAVLLEPNHEGYGVKDSILRSDGSGKTHLHMKSGGSLRPASIETVTRKEHFIYQEGQPVFKFAVTRMADVSEELLKRNQLTGDDIAFLVPHQANKRIIDATAQRIGLSDDKVMVNIQRYGNTTAGTIPLCLSDWESQLKKGDLLVLAAFGGGFTWGATLIKWGAERLAVGSWRGAVGSWQLAVGSWQLAVGGIKINMEIKIRKAQASDCERMLELVRELAVFEKAPDEVTVTLEHFIETGFGKNPVWQALVAVELEKGIEKIIGISLWYMRYSTWKGLRLYLEDLIVTEVYRGKGIGKKLFDETVTEARKLKVSGMMWQVLDWNEPAIAFYKKYGADISSEWLNCSLTLQD